MSLHNKGLLGEGSSPGTPLTLDEEEGTKRKLRTLTSDPLSRDLGDPEFMDFKTKQFERAYPGKQELDASGRAIDSPPVVKDIEPFKPKVKRRDLDFGAPVGAGKTAKNDLSDLIGAKRGLKIDGLMNPEGPTVKALRGLLYPPGTASNVGQPVDLSRAAARPLATPVAARAPGAQPKDDAPRAALGDPPDAPVTTPNTDGGETLLAQAKTPQPATASAAAKDPWPQSPVSPTYREEIHKRESAQKNYQSLNVDKHGVPAWGRYQLRPDILKDIGMLDANGNWTGKYGVKDGADFLKKPLAQEKAVADALATYSRQLRNKGAIRTVGQQVDGLKAKFTVTEDGLVAGAHREGAGAVNRYLKHQNRNGWKSNFSSLSPNDQTVFKAIETRLREFEKIRRRKTPTAP